MLVNCLAASLRAVKPIFDCKMSKLILTHNTLLFVVSRLVTSAASGGGTVLPPFVCLLVIGRTQKVTSEFSQNFGEEVNCGPHENLSNFGRLRLGLMLYIVQFQ